MSVVNLTFCIALFFASGDHSAIANKYVGEEPQGEKAASQDPDMLVREADVFLARGELYPALLKYLEASRLNPKSETIFNKLGITYSQLQLSKEAIEALNKSIRLNKTYPFSYNNLGSVYFTLRDLKNAEKFFKKAIKLSPNTASFHLNLGTAYFEKKNYKKAMEEYKKALALDGDVLNKTNAFSLKAPSESLNDPARNYYLARIYGSQSDVDQTVKFLKLASDRGYKILDLVPREPDFDPVRKNPRFVEFLEDTQLKEFLKR